VAIELVPCGNANIGEVLGFSGAGNACLALERALAKCLHSAFIGHALQLGLLLVQKTCKVQSGHISGFFFPFKKQKIIFIFQFYDVATLVIIHKRN
jgi:hypothetical protein